MTAAVIQTTSGLLSTIVVVGIVAVGLGYIVSQFRAGGVRGATEAIAQANAELAVLTTKIVRLEQDLAHEREENRVLRGRLDELAARNNALTKLVMGETVPKAMRTEIAANAEENRTVFIAEIARIEHEYLIPLTQKRIPTPRRKGTSP